MSESMAFIGGVAVAGLAALVLLKGANNPVQPNFISPQIQSPVVSQPFANQPVPYGATQAFPNATVPTAVNGDQLRVENERLKMQFEGLQREHENLKKEYQQVQYQLQAFNNQQQLNAMQQQSNQQASQLQQSQPWWTSGPVWGVAGIALTIGGGIVAAGVSALFSQKSSPRPVRTVQVIHPYNGSSNVSLAPTTRRAEFLPPRNEARRVESTGYDETY